MYPSRKKALEMRILDLKSRIEELNSLIEAQSDWVVSGFEELRFSQEEITAVAPQDFYISEYCKERLIWRKKSCSLSMMSNKDVYRE